MTADIIRRVDDVGRVVIPFDIRKKLHIETNTPLEFFVQGDKIVVQKYERSNSDFRSMCAKIVEKYRGTIKTVSYVDSTTTIILENGILGKSRYNGTDIFDMNVAIAYALQDAGVSLNLDKFEQI